MYITYCYWNCAKVFSIVFRTCEVYRPRWQNAIIGIYICHESRNLRDTRAFGTWPLPGYPRPRIWNVTVDHSMALRRVTVLEIIAEYRSRESKNIIYKKNTDNGYGTRAVHWRDSRRTSRDGQVGWIGRYIFA